MSQEQWREAQQNGGLWITRCRVFGTVPTCDTHRRVIPSPRDPRSAVLGTVEGLSREGADFVVIRASGSLIWRSRCGTARGDPGNQPRRRDDGGGLLRTERENPYWENYDDILEICRASGMALKYCRTYRRGSIADAMDATHLEEIGHQAELVRRARERGVKVSVELVNHAPAPHTGVLPAWQGIASRLAVRCSRADADHIGIGYDYVVGAIGAATAVLHERYALCASPLVSTAIYRRSMTSHRR